MNILFLHKGFPGQFKYLAQVLAQNPLNLILFLTADTDIPSPQGINKIVYKPEEIPKKVQNNLYEFEIDLAHSKGAAKMLYLLKTRNIVPDVIIAHSSCMFVKDIFPKIPFINYCEWMDSPSCPAIRFSGEEPDDNYKMQIKTSNTSKIMSLCSADGAISPTLWQKSQFPPDLQGKIEVIHDGVNTDVCTPDEKSVFEFEGHKFTKEDEVVTYATRGMEPMRGFPEFMKAAEILLKKRPNLKILVGGNDKVWYGKPLKTGTYKQKLMKELDIDTTRLHFVGSQDFNDYIKMLQISSAHIYATYPFILSWSIVEAMSCACPLVCSSTEPVLEVIKDGYNGILYDFYNIEMMVEKIEWALDNKDKMKVIRENARKTAIENYDLKDKLANLIFYIQSVIKNSKS